jgi:broad specificity phosphatase PhoE
MPRLILVKHSLPEVNRAVPPSQWRLGDEGRRRCGALASALAVYRPAAIVASEEPKAEETARLVAEAWGQGYEARPGLHEHRREALGWLSEAEFEAGVRQLFAQLSEPVFGEETGAEALARFATAVGEAVGHHPGQNLVVVAHGTVIALYVMARAGVDGFDLWRRLGLPSFVVLTHPAGELELVAEALEADDGT